MHTRDAYNIYEVYRFDSFKKIALFARRAYIGVYNIPTRVYTHYNLYYVSIYIEVNIIL